MFPNHERTSTTSPTCGNDFESSTIDNEDFESVVLLPHTTVEADFGSFNEFAAYLMLSFSKTPHCQWNTFPYSPGLTITIGTIPCFSNKSTYYTTTMEAVTPQELLQNPHILLRCYQDPSIPLKSFEGKVGAITANGEHFITSPNSKVVYALPSRSHMTFKRDCRLGMDDFLLWPQPFIHEHCHLAAIPRAPETLDPKNATHILFARAVDEKHFVPNNGRTLSGLGNLSRDMLQQLKAVAANLQTKAEKYWADDSSAKKTRYSPTSLVSSSFIWKLSNACQ
ncbi:hypothetical protein M413DRAFT_32941 [Hebeloma cylindrosporum]|uniref:Uncharacterized protein n=1 Tax=Hebeloma cylindrosporum TaxID=76867 RepID=A0A0C2Y1A9_HEBCY|nr:hypothetical protein M413DRAFT_32941 [Hebeloma cylindrosporum h7]